MLKALSTIGGGFTFGLEPTLDGRLSTRFQNTAFGAGVGAAGAYGLDKIAKGTGNVALNLAKRWDAYKSSLLQPKLGSEFITTHSGEVTRTFTPAFNHVENYSSKAAFGGELYPKSDLPKLVRYLERRGVHVYEAIDEPCFIGRKAGAHHIYLPENPTVLQVKHELSHWLDFKKLGFDKYAGMSVYQREKMVLDRLQHNRIWEKLNSLEKEFSVKYVERFKPKIRKGPIYEQ